MVLILPRLLKNERKGYRISGRLGQKQGYGWGSPSQHATHALTVPDEAFVGERTVNNPAKTQSLSSRRDVLFINISSFLFGWAYEAEALWQVRFQP